MEVNYQLTVDDYRRAIKASRNRNSFLRWSYRLSQGIVILALGVGVTLFAIEPHNRAIQNLAPLYVILMFWILWFLGTPYLSARSQFRASPSTKTPINFTFTDEGLHFRSKLADSKVDWSAYVNWVEEKAIFAVFPHPRIFIVIPKRAFSADQLIEFRELLCEKVKRK
jgi:YcxB-like protein